jgi:hypothetical protein
MTGKYDDRLKDYVDVKERVRLFYEAYPEGRLVTLQTIGTREPDDVPRIWVEAAAYRYVTRKSDDSLEWDPLPGRGWSWMMLPGSTPYTKGSEIENAETSAWGRAIGALGIGIATSIASSDEVRSKAVVADVERGDDGSLIGVVQVGDKVTSDYSIRQTPDGPALGFRLRGDKGGILVEAKGELATQLDTFRERIVGSRVTVWGTVGDRSFKTDKRTTTYQALAAERISVPLLGLLPMEPDEDEPPKDTVTVPMFTAEEQAAIDEVLS